MRAFVLMAAALALAVVVGNAVAAASATTSKVTLTEFKVKPKPASAKAGKVTFAVKNAGSAVHELVVLRTNIAPGKLPVKNGRAVEKGKVGEVSNLRPGKTGKLTRALKKGKYVLLCNVPGHYQAGQFTGFRVK
jgi:uncharacterized cupredoxin-like copper-binding protein